MTEPILSPEYWANRLKAAQANGGVNLHHAIFRCPKAEWDAIAERHRSILAQVIRPTDSILDAGCGWGRLLDLLSPWYYGPYTGIDVSPEFTAMGWERYPQVEFRVADLRDLSFLQETYDWAVLISIRPMVRRNLGEEAWERMLTELCRVARKILFLEYDREDRGRVYLPDLGTEEYAT